MYGIIIGIAIGVLAVIVIIVAVICLRRRKQQDKRVAGEWKYTFAVHVW